MNNTGPLPLDAAQQAEDRGVRVYTIGFGTPNGSEFASCQSSDPFAGGFGLVEEGLVVDLEAVASAEALEDFNAALMTRL